MQNRQNQIGLLTGGTQTGFGAAQGIGNAAIGTGTNLANLYGNLGQGIGQGYADMGAARASSYMGPTNMLAQLLGQGIQGGAYLLGKRIG